LNRRPSDRPAPKTPGTAAEVGRAGVRRVLWTTLWLNLAVSAAKVLVGRLTGSLSMEADGYHSLLDGSNNVIGLVVTGLAYAPPDEGHPYGHRKFETAATLGIGLGMLTLAYRVVESTLGQATHPRLPEIGLLNWSVMAATLAVNLFVTWYETREGERLRSPYLVADAAHTRSDVYVTFGVIASFAGVAAGIAWADAAVAVAIAGLIAVLAVRILVGSFHVLTDRAVIPAPAIASRVSAIPGVLDCQDVRTRGGHGAVYVDLVVHLDGGVSLRAAHAVADAIEAALKAAWPEIVDVVVHLEPAEGT
jgi:cation diffusion facilitator family transporter